MLSQSTSIIFWQFSFSSIKQNIPSVCPRSFDPILVTYYIKTSLPYSILCTGDPEVTTNIYCKSRNLPNTDTQNYSKNCGDFWVTQYVAYYVGFSIVSIYGQFEICGYVTIGVCNAASLYWVTQKLPQICTVILRIRIGKVAWFAVYICGNFWVTQYSINYRSYIKWVTTSWPYIISMVSIDLR